MPTIVACPSCSRQLRVPDELLGKQVKCPSCQTIFTAEAPEPAPPPPPPVEPEPVPLEPAAPEYAPNPFATAHNEFEGIDRRSSFDNDRRPAFDDDRRRDVMQRVMGPTLALMIVKGMTMMLLGLPLLGSLVTIITARNDGAIIGGLVQGFLIVASLVIDFLVIYGALQMRQLRSHGWGMAACILAIIPHACCLFSLPFGIWGLVVLNDPEVRRAFPR